MSAFPGWSRGLQAALDRLSIASPHPPRGQTAGHVISRSLGRALEFADYRAYVPGDDPRLVDWRAYNRLDRLYLKQYREERARTITLLLDCSSSLDWGESDQHKGLYARRLAAALTWIGLGHLERVAVFVLRGDSAERLPTPLGRSGVQRLFTTLEMVHENGPLALPVAVSAALTQLRGDGPLFLISDLLDAEWRQALRMLARREQSDVILQLLAPDEWDPPLGDEVELEDSETGELRQTRFGPIERQEYRSRLDAFIHDIRTLSQQLGLRHVALDTGQPLADVLLKQLPAVGVLQ